MTNTYSSRVQFSRHFNIFFRLNTKIRMRVFDFSPKLLIRYLSYFTFDSNLSIINVTDSPVKVLNNLTAYFILEIITRPRSRLINYHLRLIIKVYTSKLLVSSGSNVSAIIIGACGRTRKYSVINPYLWFVD